MSKIRIGLIGYGSWTRMAFVPALRQSNKVKIVSAAACSEASKQNIRNELGKDVSIYGSYEELLGGQEIDAVMVAVPDSIHQNVMEAILEAGVAAYYEPPLATTREGIQNLLKKLLATDQILHSDLELGFSDALIRAAELVQNGVIGKIQTLELKLRSNWAQFEGPDMCLAHHLGPWYMDGLNSLIGKFPQRVLVMDGFGKLGRRQNNCLVHLDYDGTWGTINLNINSSAELETTIDVTGDNGELQLDYFKNTIKLQTMDNPVGKKIKVQPTFEIVGGWPGEAESVAAFIEAVLENKPSRTGNQLAAKLYLAGLAIEESKDSGGWAKINAITT